MKFRQLLGFIVLAVFFSSQVYSQVSSEELTFKGQNEELSYLEKTVSKVGTKMVEVDSTCTRQVVDGYENVCHDETRYRNQCEWIPGYQDCRMEYFPVCHEERRTRRACHNEPGQRICRTNPFDGSQTCRIVGGGQVCRDEPYMERVCHNTQRRVCHNVPERQQCRDVAYTERVCENQARYRTESYACKKLVPEQYTYDFKTVAEVKVIFESIELTSTADFQVTLMNENEVELKLINNPSDLVVIQKSVQQVVVDENEEQRQLQVIFNVKLVKKSDLAFFQGTKVNGIDLFRSGDVLAIYLNQALKLNQLNLSVKLMKSKSAEVIFNKSIQKSELLGKKVITLKLVDNGASEELERGEYSGELTISSLDLSSASVILSHNLPAESKLTYKFAKVKTVNK